MDPATLKSLGMSIRLSIAELKKLKKKLDDDDKAVLDAAIINLNACGGIINKL